MGIDETLLRWTEHWVQGEIIRTIDDELDSFDVVAFLMKAASRYGFMANLKVAFKSENET